MKNNINNMNDEELEIFLDKRIETVHQLINQYINLIKDKTRKNHKFKSNKQRAYYINNIYNYVSWVNEQIKMNENVSRDAKVIPRRGEIWTCELGQNIGSEENKIRPVIIIQNDTGNKNAPTTIIAPISNRPKKIAVHIELRESDYKLENGEKNHITGTVLLEQIKVVSKARLGRHIATLNNDFMEILDSKIKISLNL
ncbi:type II toxin-antitoxin system PemK/MazF family toxin [Clostridium botulinum]|uniref:Growth inhibitor PemK n=1 Tax=Clostridium botulinum C/D str. DC5 TaxID=1443128 RepID=A0A0A0ILG4_CLOBO|nr:type II toxin-antitoxin system PemK/MazF family toxin [Clostridium botulinum]KEI03074.1 growth inhibitor PemK [Clostridium botulinum C/D str. BKT75002]KEI13490.1 growth inhibitor PemK [Clostridium botulinum C/D str. BKT2873]KGM94970.1 growth inhibitor PemK [Clostridium botulinum D str. CCUG 7971]KGN01758.1 growth inhibitor PemK [Clostridium botulinum C/D str. DC5]KOC49303.1 growth inhibitor PemK [Clostridium botulinum]